MKIYLVQHGNAKSEDEDPARSLSKKGVNDVKKIAEFLKNKNISVHAILHSEKLRAKETAEILMNSVKSIAGIEEVEFLKPNDDISIMIDFINNQDKDLMLVGHLPYMSKISSFLIENNVENEIIKFHQGGVVCLEKLENSIENDNFNINWIIIPDLLD